ncbi:iron ABC transporter [bacterium]|nr:iron ABC transporter [bacterium]
MTSWEFIAIDLPPLLTAILSSSACGLLGNYLILRRQSLMGDAIAHSVLPGIVIAFLLSSHRSSLSVFLGAAIAGVVSALCIEFLRRNRFVETSATIGIVFPLFFALGVLLIEQAAARHVDLDADCLLYGQLESIFWLPPSDITTLLTASSLQLLPEELITSALCFLSVLFIILLFKKELTLSSFDPTLATSMGFSSNMLNNLLMLVLAVAVVASFKAVGSILVIAMIISPAACARLFTDKLNTQLMLSVLFAILMSVGGYCVAVFLPLILGSSSSLNAAGMIAALGGILLIGSICFSPRYGTIGRRYRKNVLQNRILQEDILAALFRLEEDASKETRLFSQAAVQEILKKSSATSDTADYRKRERRTVKRLVDNNFLVRKGALVGLTADGRNEARKLIRTHRLLESYLVEEAGVEPDHVHETAEALEHFTSESQDHALARATPEPRNDPHGKRIPLSPSKIASREIDKS